MPGASFFCTNARALGGKRRRKRRRMPSTLIRAGLRSYPSLRSRGRRGARLEPSRLRRCLKSFARRRLERLCGGLRRRVGAVAKFSSTDRAALRKLGVPWRRASRVLAPVSLRDLTPRLVASVAPPLGTRHRVRGKEAKPARLGPKGVHVPASRIHVADRPAPFVVRRRFDIIAHTCAAPQRKCARYALPGLLYWSC